ncbi:HutD family protein [Rheinheimera sp.]|uniref:HutD/Ves family protein n=1 Tax=Rheinheimera sp. TaxID=1869214 RepID=UPI00307D97C4
MRIQLIKPEHWLTQAWQNGGGITHQLLRQDDEQGLLWRMSIAEVASDGPFSAFPGIDRIILLLQGKGVRLQLPADTVELATPYTAFEFAGETAVQCYLTDGAVLDFNLMSRRGAVRASLDVHQLPHCVDLATELCGLGVFLAKGSAVLQSAQQCIELTELDLCWQQQPVQELNLTGSQDAVVFIIRICSD